MKKIFQATFLILVASVLIIEPAFAAKPSAEVLDMFDTNNIYYYNPSGSDDLCGSYATRLTGNSIEEKIWNFFIDQGFSDVQVAGILGNAQQESNFSPTRSRNGSYYGLFQWHTGYNQTLLDRIKNAGLGKYLESDWWGIDAWKSIPENDLNQLLEIQLNYAINDYTPEWVAELKKQTSIEVAAEAFLTIFERAVDGESPILYYEPFQGLLYQGADSRRNNAKELYNKYSGKGTNASKNLTTIEDGKNLTIIGDSITEYAKNAILNKFPELKQTDIYSANGRTWQEAINIAKNINSVIKENVIFALGSNNTELSTFDIANAINAIGSNKNIVFVTNWSTLNNYESNNNLFLEYAKQNSNIVIADWKSIIEPNSSNYLLDEINPNETGSKALADALYDAVNSNATINGCSVSGEFASLVKAYAWPEYHKGPFTNRMPAYANAVSQSISEGRYVGGSINGVPGIDCGGFVTVLTQNSGLEPNYNDHKGNTTTQEEWVNAHGWILLNGSPNRQIDTSILQPGDIAFSRGHTFIYVGEIPGFGSKIASAAYSFSNARAPMAGREDLLYGNGSIVRWYRNPKYSSNSSLSYASNLQNKTWSAE